MAKNINGETYYLIDVVCDEDFVYEVYQNDRDEVVYIPIQSL